MEKLTNKKYPLIRQETDKKKIILPGYPTYPDSEDIYNQGKEEFEIDPEQLTKDKENLVSEKNNEKNFENDFSGVSPRLTPYFTAT